MKVKLQSEVGTVKECKLGFSWTVFFFGIFPALFRGDLKWALIQFVVAWVTCGISHFVFSFTYNKIYIKDLLEKRFVPATEEDRLALVKKGIIPATVQYDHLNASL